MHHVRMQHRPDGLRQPTLIAAFEGWNDAGEAATGALDAVAEATDSTTFADIDPEEFFDFQVNRPNIAWQGEQRTIQWPRNTFSSARTDGEADLVLLHGREPNMRWRAFTDSVLALAEDLQVRRIITLGALQVDLPHTRRVSFSGASSDPEVASRHGLRRSTYEGPTGIVGVLHQAATLKEIEAITFWVGVPHYLSGTAYLRASLALAEHLGGLLGIDLALDRLADESEAQMSDIADLVAEDEDLAAYVEELEARADADGDLLSGDDLPTPPVSGEELAREVERYLRDRPAE